MDAQRCPRRSDVARICPLTFRSPAGDYLFRKLVSFSKETLDVYSYGGLIGTRPFGFLLHSRADITQELRTHKKSRSFGKSRSVEFCHPTGFFFSRRCAQLQRRCAESSSTGTRR